MESLTKAVRIIFNEKRYYIVNYDSPIFTKLNIYTIDQKKVPIWLNHFNISMDIITIEIFYIKLKRKANSLFKGILVFRMRLG